MKKPVSFFIILLILCFALVSISQIEIVKAESTFYIRADGSVDGTEKIQREGNLYTFLGNISIDDSGVDGLIVERDNIVIDGSGYSLQLAGETVSSIGIKLMERTNVTIKNLWIRDFNYGIQLRRSSSNTILENYINSGINLRGAHNNSIIENYLSHIMIDNSYTDGISNGNLFLGNNIKNGGVGINSIDGSKSIIMGNNITNCSIYGLFLENGQQNIIAGNNFENNAIGIFFSHGASNNTIYDNNFVNNQKDMDDAHSVLPYLYEISVNSWDNGSRGNYWSNYNGTDNDSDGIGDNPHFIYEKNQDNYPLMNPVDISEIPEFSSRIILPLFLVATLLSIIVRKKLRRL